MAAVLVTLCTQVSAAQARHQTPRLDCGPEGKPALNGTACIDKTPARVTACSARKDVRYYRSRLNYWAQRMGAGESAGQSGSARTSAALPGGNRPRLPGVAACPHYLAHVLQRKAHAAHRAYLRWHRDQYEWQLWLPDKFARVGACETGYGRKPGSWRWDSGMYVSAFGIYRPAYEAYHRWTGRNTPREQYEVAAAIQARYGWGAWGCGGA